MNFGLAMGFGAVWPMHFIGMTALSLTNESQRWIIEYEAWSNFGTAVICAIGGSVGIFFITS